MAFTPTAAPTSSSTWAACNLTLQNGAARTTWANRYIIPMPPPSFEGETTDLGTVFGASSSTLVSIPVANASNVELVSSTLPAGLSLSHVSNSELQLIGGTHNYAQNQIHVFTLRIQSLVPIGAPFHTWVGSPFFTERTFILRARPQPTGVWSQGAGSQLLMVPNQPFERQIQSVGTWSLATSGGGACATPGIALGADGLLAGVPTGAWTSTCDLRVQNGAALTTYGNRTLRSQP